MLKLQGYSWTLSHCTWYTKLSVCEFSWFLWGRHNFCTIFKKHYLRFSNEWKHISKKNIFKKTCFWKYLPLSKSVSAGCIYYNCATSICVLYLYVSEKATHFPYIGTCNSFFDTYLLSEHSRNLSSHNNARVQFLGKRLHCDECGKTFTRKNFSCGLYISAGECPKYFIRLDFPLYLYPN